MTSAEYWKDREEQAAKEYQLTEAEYVEQLNDIYDYLYDQINREIESFYSRYASREGITISDAKKRVSSLEIEEYERKAKKYVAEKDFSAEANQEMRIYNLTMKVNRLELLKADIGLEMVSSFDEMNEVFGTALNERVVQEFARQAGILGMTTKDATKTAGVIVNASFKNATFSDRIWMYQDQMKAQLANLLETGLVQGRNPRQLAPSMMRLFDVSRYDAERLLRTELARVQTEAQKQSFLANGFDEYQFNANGTACEICAALDEQHFRLDDMMPGTNAPPMHPNCRCGCSAYMPDADYNEWINTYKDHGLDFENWKRDVTKEYIENAAPEKGRIVYEDGYIESKHRNEIKNAQWIHNVLGGDIVLLKEVNQDKIQTPDYLWNKKNWELKNISTYQASDNAVRGALKQISSNPGGIILDCGENNIEINDILGVVGRRIYRSCDFDVDVLIHNENDFRVFRYKK